MLPGDIGMFVMLGIVLAPFLLVLIPMWMAWQKGPEPQSRTAYRTEPEESVTSSARGDNLPLKTEETPEVDAPVVANR